MTVAQPPAVPETALAPGVVAALPTQPPAPPWRCRVDAVLWWHRAVPGAREVLPAALQHRAGAPLSVGAFLHYLDSPVGPYDEVLAVPHLLGLLPRLHIPFIAVDSPASVLGGRTHWDLPKVPCSFTRAGSGVRAEGRGWSLGAAASPIGPWLPVLARVGSEQIGATGSTRRFTSTAWALSRCARVEVEVDPGCPMAGWLLTGRHRGVVLRGRVVVGAAR